MRRKKKREKLYNGQERSVVSYSTTLGQQLQKIRILSLTSTSVEVSLLRQRMSPSIKSNILLAKAQGNIDFLRARRVDRYQQEFQWTNPGGVARKLGALAG